MPLDPHRLTSRVRDVLRGQPGSAGTEDSARPLDEREAPGAGVREIRFVPDEAVPVSAETATGCVVIERTYDAHVRHGRLAVSDYAETLAAHIPALALLAADERATAREDSRRTERFAWDTRARRRDDAGRVGAPTAGPLLFFDLETTGLSGGAGTVAFLVGCGYFEDDGFRTRQYFLSGYEAEHELLVAVSQLAREFAGVVSFNGRTFDVPLIGMRYAFHRLDSPFEGLPHFDMLHPARRLWRRRSGTLGSTDDWQLTAPGSDPASCALKSLEEAILGTGRVGDVPGFEIPSRYFAYLRTGDLEPLQAVFEHNRLDLLSLAALTGLAARMAAQGPSAVPTPHEALAMGGLYQRAGRLGEAEACYVRASGLGDAGWDAGTIERDIRADALRSLALLRRRQRRWTDAAEAWAALVDAATDRATEQEARRALAIHHEHRTHDLEAARQAAEEAARAERDPDRLKDLQHRLDRIGRKRERRSPGPTEW